MDGFYANDDIRGGSTFDLLPENNLDAIRLVLAVVVIWGHSYTLTGGRALPDPVSVATCGTSNAPSLAVDAFFAISGYLIAMSFTRSRSPRSFLTKRAARIIPGYLAAFAISVFVVTPIACRSVAPILSPYHLARAVGYAITFGPWVVAGSFRGQPFGDVVNGSLWTIHYELICYLLIWAAGVLGILNRPKVLVAGLATTAVVSALTDAFRLSDRFAIPVAFNFLIGNPYEFTRLLSFFVAGTTLFCLRQQASRSGRTFAVAFASGVLAASHRAIAPLVLPFSLTYVLFCLVLLSLPLIARLKHYVGGDYSYGTYLYAFPIQQLVVMAWINLTGAPPTPGILFAFTTPLAIAFGAASWHGVERWFLPPAAAWTRHDVKSAMPEPHP